MKMVDNDIPKLLQNAEFEEILLEKHNADVLMWTSNKLRTLLSNRRKNQL
jgi:hypothetical protein